MSLNRREVQDAYLELLGTIVQARWAVSSEDKEVIDGYWNMTFKVTEQLTLNLNLNGAGASLQIFQGHVRAAIPGLEEMMKDVAGGVIHDSAVATALSERINRTLDISNRFLGT